MRHAAFASLLLVACGGAATPAPESASDANTRAEPRAAARASNKRTPNPKRAVNADDLDGIMFVRTNQHDQRVPVQPAEIDLDSLPMFVVPEPLDYQKTPTSMPASISTPPLRTEKLDASYGYGGSYGQAVYIVLDAKMGRLQIGSVGDDRHASDRVYRTCGDSYYTQPTLTPARWETLTMKDGQPEYRVADAWFDAKSCESSVVNETVVRPKPLLGGLIYGFRSRCDKCPNKETVTFLSPALSQLAASGLGGPATVSHGSFSIIRLPLRKGGAASFTGMIHSSSLSQWLSPMPKNPDNVGVAEPVNILQVKSSFSMPAQVPQQLSSMDAHLGIEIQQTVNDAAPTAIAYATFMTR